MKTIKKFLALLLSLIIIVSAFSSAAAITASADVVEIEKIRVDLTKSTAIKADKLGVRFDGIMPGAVRADIHIGYYPAVDSLWKDAIMTINDSQGKAVKFEAGYKYAINVKYYVLTTTMAPTVAIVHNNSVNSTSDNGSVTLAMSEKHATVGTYTLSVVTNVESNMVDRPLRLVFGGNASVVVTAVDVQRVAADTDVSTVNYVVNGVKTTEFATDTLKVPTYENSIHYYKNELLENDSVIDSIFGGWYTDSALSIATKAVTDGATYYAKWASVTRKMDLPSSNRMVTWNSSIGANEYYTNNMLSITPNEETGAVTVVSNNTNNDVFQTWTLGTSRGDAHMSLEYYDYEDSATYDNDYSGYATVPDKSKQFVINIKYSVTNVSGTAKIGLVACSSSITGGSNCKTRVIASNSSITAVGNYNTFASLSGGGGIDSTYGGTVSGISDYAGYKFRLHFVGTATFVIEAVTIQEVYANDSANSVGLTYKEKAYTSTVDNRVLAVKDHNNNLQIPKPYKMGDVIESEFGGWYTDAACTTAVSTSPTAKQSVYAKWNYVKSNINLSNSNTTGNLPSGSVYSFGHSGSGDTYIANFQRYDQNLFAEGEFTNFKNPAYLNGTSQTLEYYDNDSNAADKVYGGYVNITSGYKYVVTVKYNVLSANSNAAYHPQIAIVSNTQALGDNNQSTIYAAKKHATAGNGHVISAVVDDTKSGQNLRIGFGGVGKIELLSVTVTEVHKTATDYAKVVYSYDAGTQADFLKKGSDLMKIPHKENENFIGWYAGQNKVETVNGDTNLTALYHSKYDTNASFSFDITDVLWVKAMGARNSSDLAFDTNRNGIVGDAEDIAMVRAYILANYVYFPFVIDKNNISEYTIINGNSTSLMNDLATQSLSDAINTNLGAQLNVANETDGKKIVVGINTSALNNQAINTLTGVRGNEYAVEEYKIFVYKNNLYIEGGSDYAVAAAVNAFVKHIESNKEFAEYIVISGVVDANSELLDGYKRVWSDEFNGETINTSGKWWFKSGTAPGTYYPTDSKYYTGSIVSSLTGNKYGGPWSDVEGSPKWQDGIINYGSVLGENYTLQNGAILLNTKRTSNGYNATELHAAHSYKYGIMTARVKFDTKNAAASSVWARTDDNVSKIVNEFDFVENYGNNQVIPNLHIWDNTEGATPHTDLDGQIDVQNRIENVEDSYHDIAMIWTSEKIQFYFDGVLYLEQDITDQEKYAAFHVSTRMVFGISAGTKDYAASIGKNGIKPGDILLSNINSFNENLSIDYVRWYQK